MRVVIFLSAIVWLPVLTFAQGAISHSVDSERSKPNVGINSDSTSIERVMIPAVDPYVFYDPYRDIHRAQSGLYFGRKTFGIETTYRVPKSLQYVSLYAGLINPENSQTLWTGGFSYGREFRLNDKSSSTENSNVEYYFRAGPGIGIVGTGTFSGSRTEYALGLHSTMYLGAQYHLSEKTSLFVHGGGKTFWFPSLNEVGFITAPVISFGFQFSTSPQVPFIQF
jgi:hypothetical protein